MDVQVSCITHVQFNTKCKDRQTKFSLNLLTSCKYKHDLKGVLHNVVDKIAIDVLGS